jgi:hypothetical protein
MRFMVIYRAIYGNSWPTLSDVEYYPQCLPLTIRTPMDYR